PTKHCYDQFSKVLRCRYFAWPVDTYRFQFRPRTVCNRFLFIGGHGGYKGRKGIEVVLEAKRLWPDLPLSVRCQANVAWPSNVEVLPATESNADLYATGDVLIAPHSVDGLGLEPMEA